MINYIETKRVLTAAQSNLVAAIRNKLDEINKAYKFTDNTLVSDTDLDKD